MNSRSGRPDDDRRPYGEDTFAEVMDSFTLGSGRRRRKRSAAHEPRAEQVPEGAREEAERPAAAGMEEAEPAPPDAPASSVRSYTWTGGRTKSKYRLELETLVSTSEGYLPSRNVRMEHQSIAELCHHPRSVAEVGALLGIPVGVARVLLADMAELGLVTVHQTVTDSGSAPHLMLMERVLSGLRRL